MLFNSYVFLFLFLPITVVGFFVISYWKNTSASLFWLLLTSLFFYGWWNPKYLLLIGLSIGVNYWVGVAIHYSNIQFQGAFSKGILAAGVLFNLALLGYYKYTGFFLENCNIVLGTDWSFTSVILPLALSFFTFTQIAYLVDAFHGRTQAYDFLSYSTFVTFFPHLIAGPIVSYRKLMPQFSHPETYRLQWDNIAVGFSLLAMGLAKKVLIADNLSPMTQWVYDTLAPGGDVYLLPAWLGSWAYTMQIYFDFSGYSDMAVGLAWLFNIRFPLNFYSPCKAHSIAEFWNCWHITLSNFLRDYIYFPLGGSRCAHWRSYCNLILTMFFSGLWHGANWTFVLWGVLHGIYLSIYRLYTRMGGKKYWPSGRTGLVMGIAITFTAVLFSRVFFRSHNMAGAFSILGGLCGMQGIGLPYTLQVKLQNHGFSTDLGFTSWLGGIMWIFPVLIIATGIAFFAPNSHQIFRIADNEGHNDSAEATPPLWNKSMLWAVFTGILFAFCILQLSGTTEFLYFQF